MNHYFIVVSLVIASMAGVACEKSASTSSNMNPPKGLNCEPGEKAMASANLANSSDPCREPNKDLLSDEYDPSIDNPVPIFDSANLETRFNRNKIARANIPDEYKDKVFVAKRVPFHRAIWLDLTREVWASWNRFEDRVGKTFHKILQDDQAAEYLLRFAQNSQNYEVDQVSIHQPLKMPSFLPNTDELVFDFFTLGHTAVASVDKPSTKSLVVALSPYQDPAAVKAFARPEDYTLIYQKVGIYADNLVQECNAEFEQQSKGGLPNIEILTKCETILKGLTNYTFNQVTYQANNAFDELFKKQSVAIWDAVCPENYKAIGQVATNGRTDKPFTENDFSQTELEILTGKVPGVSPTLKAAMYCIKKDYLSKGKLSKPIVSNEQVTIYQVEAADKDGYSDSNLFYAVKGRPSAELLKKVEVWVLKKSATIFLKDEIMPKKAK